MNKTDYTGGETVGEMIDRLGQSFLGLIETAKGQFLNMPAQKITTILTMVAFLALLGWGMTALEIFIKAKREQRRLRQKNTDENKHQH